MKLAGSGSRKILMILRIFVSDSGQLLNLEPLTLYRFIFSLEP